MNKKMMIYRKCIAVILVIVMCLSIMACGKKKNDSGISYKIYYTNSSSNKLVSLDYTTGTSDSVELANELINQMNTKSKENDIKVIKPDTFSVLNITIEDNVMSVFFAKEYNDMSVSNELLYRSSMVKTLTQIDGIEYIQFYIDDKLQRYPDGTEIGMMSADDFVDDSDESLGNVEWRELNLYFANKYGDKLIKTSETVAYSKNISLEKIIVEKLIKGPINSDSYMTLPSDLKLLNVSVSDRVCYVNLSNSFLTEMVNVSSEIPIYSIVNSLCELDTIDSVKILINGDSSRTFRESISLESSFTFNDSIVK